MGDRIIFREPVPDFTATHTGCIVCGKSITLWINGGELDAAECCGHIYRLTYGDAPLMLEVRERVRAVPPGGANERAS